MPKPAITTFSSIAVKPSSTNKDNGLYAPQLTTAQIAAIPANTLVNGAIVYNTDENLLKSFVNGVLVNVGTGPNVGDVSGPGGAVEDNIATFDGVTGKIIKDSGVAIGQVAGPLPFRQFSPSLLAQNAFVNEIRNLGHIKFTNGTGFIFLDSDISVAFFLNSFGPGPTDEQVCTLFTGGFPGSSTTPSALVEIQSPTGALLLSRLSQAQINIFPFPTAGMVLFNKDTNRLSFYNGTSWLDPASGDSITLTGAVTGTGSGSINTSLATTVECQNRIQIFESPVPDDFFVVRIQNQALLTTGLEIGAANAPTILLGYNPVGIGAYLECRSVPFAILNNGNERFRLTPSGNVGIGTTTPNAPLQFASTLANRKIVLYELVNNDHQYLGFGSQSNILRYQVANLNNDHIFYAATSPTTSNELARITGDGNIGIGGVDPSAPLQFTNALVNRKIVLYALVNNDHQFFGFGVNTDTARYQVPSLNSNHIFYAATSATTSNELARITGTGDIVAASNIYGRRPSGIIYAPNGAPSTTPVVGTWVKIASGTTPMVATNLFSTLINNRLVYTGSRTIMAQINLNITISPSTNLTTNYGISIYKNGVRVFGSDSYVTTTNATTYYSVSTSGFTTMITNDYIEAFILSDRTNSVTTSTLILSVTTT
jgi:hypothetical protein